MGTSKFTTIPIFYNVKLIPWLPLIFSNDPGVIFVLFFLWGNVLVALAFLLSVFFEKSRTSSVVGYIIVFASGILAAQGSIFD